MGRRDERRTARTLRLLVCGLGAAALAAVAGTAPVALGAAPAAHLATGGPLPATLAAHRVTGPALPTGVHSSPAGPVVHGTREGAAPAAQTLALVLPLTADEAGLKRQALAVTTLGSPQYGQFESVADLARRFGASPSARRQVTAYLRSRGATGVKIDATGLFADATMTVGLAQRLFGTPLARFRAAHGPRFVAPTAAASVPAPLSGLVTGVIGLDTQPLWAAHTRLGTTWRSAAHAAPAPMSVPAPAPTPQQASGYVPRTGTPAGCAGAVGTAGFTPNQYLNAFQYSALRQAGLGGQGERVALIEIDGFRYSDIRTFARCFGLRVPAVNAFGVGIGRALAPGGESTLDLEVLDAAAPRLKAIDVYESNRGSADVLRSLTAPLQNPRDKPQVISASLGVCEPALWQTVGKGGINAAEGSLALAAANGITILASSGDSGSSACDELSGPVDALAVSYPASSWWVTGVGGTNVALNPGNQILGQPVWNDAPVQVGAGGGGLSALFPRPIYQKAAVEPNRRAVPDVSMLADVAPGYAIYCSAKADCLADGNHNPWLPVGGTSAATPLLAGGIALVDQDLRMHGRQDLGLANSLLYSLGASSAAATVFYDVTQGNDDLGPYLAGGNGEPLGCCTAAVGYDQASGWGSVNVSTFAQLATLLQPQIVNIALSLPAHQSPVRQHQLLATVACSGRCLMQSTAEMTVGRARPIAIRSNVYLLRSKGAKTVALRFSAGQRRLLRVALAAHQRIVATVRGVILDAGGNVEKRSATQRLTIIG
jgi:subtilase family serine protease